MSEYKKEAIRVARQLGYGKETVKKIREATTESEVARIMITARHNLPDWR